MDSGARELFSVLTLITVLQSGPRLRYEWAGLDYNIEVYIK